jgi:Anthrone oxygenase
VSWWEFALRLVNVVAAGMLGGGQLLVLLAIVPMKRRWPLELSLRLHREILIEPPDRYLRPTAFVTLATGILLLVTYRHLGAAETTFTIAGLLATVGMMATAVVANFPINRQVTTLAALPVPPEYPDLQRRWDAAHRVRTAFGMLAFILFAVAALAR